MLARTCIYRLITSNTYAVRSPVNESYLPFQISSFSRVLAICAQLPGADKGSCLGVLAAWSPIRCPVTVTPTRRERSQDMLHHLIACHGLGVDELTEPLVGQRGAVRLIAGQRPIVQAVCASRPSCQGDLWPNPKREVADVMALSPQTSDDFIEVLGDEERHGYDSRADGLLDSDHGLDRESAPPRVVLNVVQVAAVAVPRWQTKPDLLRVYHPCAAEALREGIGGRRLACAEEPVDPDDHEAREAQSLRTAR